MSFVTETFGPQATPIWATDVTPALLLGIAIGAVIASLFFLAVDR
jgi:hypothetical protein